MLQLRKSIDYLHVYTCMQNYNYANTPYTAACRMTSLLLARFLSHMHPVYALFYVISSHTGTVQYLILPLLLSCLYWKLLVIWHQSRQVSYLICEGKFCSDSYTFTPPQLSQCVLAATVLSVARESRISISRILIPCNGSYRLFFDFHNFTVCR